MILIVNKMQIINVETNADGTPGVTIHLSNGEAIIFHEEVSGVAYDLGFREFDRSDFNAIAKLLQGRFEKKPNKISIIVE